MVSGFASLPIPTFTRHFTLIICYTYQPKKFKKFRSRTGRKGPYAGYYVQIKPGGDSFVGAGLWLPEAGPLALLRQAIDAKSEKLKDVLLEPRIRKDFLKGVTNDATKAVKVFTSMNTENMLKTKPKVDFSPFLTPAPPPGVAG